MARQPILSVLGHVDSGKTSLLDAIRDSDIVGGESGGITQMIGATEIPLSTCRELCEGLLQQLETDLDIPGLLFIDTPGHAAFSSLRKRGGSISDIAVLVVDVEEGVQPQTEEAIKILRESETPFVIALNKIDKIPGWKENGNTFTEAKQKQSEKVIQKIDEKIYELMGDLDEYGMMADRFDRVDNFQKKAAIIPTSAETGVGIPELVMVVTGLSQNYLADELEVNKGTGKGTVLEVSQEKGLGTTIDVIHYDGTISKEDLLVYGTAEGVKETEIRAVLEPQPLQEIRVDKEYQEVDEVLPASGVKISGKDLEGVISGAPIRTTGKEGLEQAKKEVEEELELGRFDTSKKGAVVKADSLGSLEAVMRELEDLELEVQKAEVGPVKKSDVIEVENEEPEEKAILAFNTGITEQGERTAQDKDINIFQSDIVYKIIENYQDWKEELKRKQRQKALTAVSRPAKIEVLHNHVFRSSNPAVVGVKIQDGVLNGGSLMTEDGDPVGNVKSIQEQNEKVEKAEKGDQVAVSISNATVGRDFEEGDILYVNITGKEYRQLQELKDLLTQGEKDVLDTIIDIKDSKDPHWKL
ncbi:MAG: translation initiation factor IF-2 [Candidatus Nanohalobium sp.]